MKKIHALALFMLAATFAAPAYALPRVTQDAILRDFLFHGRKRRAAVLQHFFDSVCTGGGFCHVDDQIGTVSHEIG